VSTLRVTAERLVIHEHPNADALELAQVGLYRAVVQKGAYRTGDWAVYIPEQAVLPDALIAELGLAGRLAGKAKNRVKAIRLRGELSQGIVCWPQVLRHEHLQLDAAANTDYADVLGVTKWVPEIPAAMNGEIKPAPDLLRWIDIENIKRYPNVFAAGEPVTCTEKVHGTACVATVTRGGGLFVTSKGFGEKYLSIVESERNLYWRAIRGYDVPVVADRIMTKLGADRVGIFGEVYGAGVQDLTYGAKGNVGRPGYAVFDIRVDEVGEVRWLSQEEMVNVLAGDLPAVPRLYEGPFDVDTILGLADGREQVSRTEAHIREGVVVRPQVERYSDVLGGRAIVKVVSDSYLTRNGGTEYE
jgi:RNA ligase (TIGR02306 family)